jgi:hypothetical protein
MLASKVIPQKALRMVASQTRVTNFSHKFSSRDCSLAMRFGVNHHRNVHSHSNVTEPDAEHGMPAPQSSLSRDEIEVRIMQLLRGYNKTNQEKVK